MEEMIFEYKGVVHELSDLFGCRRHLYLEKVVQGFAGSGVVGRGANPTDLLGQGGHFFCRAPLAELFESLKIGNLQIGAIHLALVIETDGDLTVSLQSCYGIYGNPFSHGYCLYAFLLRIEEATLYL
jgi:hypothetical protein